MAKRKHFGKKKTGHGFGHNKAIRHYLRSGLRLVLVLVLISAGALLSKAYMNGDLVNPDQPSAVKHQLIAEELVQQPQPLPQIHPVSEIEQPALDVQSITSDLPLVEDVSNTFPDQIESNDAPEWVKHALPKPADAKRPYIVVVIDDVGVNVKRSKDIIELQAPLTLSFLPYAQNLPHMTKRARQFGHELMVHVPMQTETRAYPGPNALTVDLEEDEIQRRLNFALTQFSGFVGINNHMGGRFTSDARGMEFVMQTLKKRKYFFLDSLTTAKSVCSGLAKQYEVPFLKRDIFIDHEETDTFVNHQLKMMEKIALSRGYAIGIGHPKRITVEHLRAWLPTLKDKGISLVPITTLLLDK